MFDRKQQNSVKQLSFNLKTNKEKNTVSSCPGIKPTYLALAGKVFTTEPPGKPTLFLGDM